MLENHKMLPDSASKTRKIDTWENESSSTGSLSRREYDFTILDHDESRGKFGEHLKLTTWICRTGNTDKTTIFTNGLTLEKCEDEFFKF